MLDPSDDGKVVAEAGSVVGTESLVFEAGGTEEVVGVAAFGELGLSGEVQLTGGTPEPVCPGISTVPAQPKFEKVASSVEVPPSAKVSTDLTWRMNPAASIDIAAVLPVYPCPLRTVSAAVIVWASAAETPGAPASWLASVVTR